MSIFRFVMLAVLAVATSGIQADSPSQNTAEAGAKPTKQTAKDLLENLQDEKARDRKSVV